MEIKELTNYEFKEFTSSFKDFSIYQTVEYALVMNHQNYDTLFLGLIDNNKIVAATVLLVEKKLGFKYGYAPRGFLIDYNDIELLKIFTEKLKKHLFRLDIIAIKLCPIIYKTINNVPQNNYDNIFQNLTKNGYYHFGYNNLFEALKPRYEAVINLENDFLSLFQNISKEYRTKIRSAERKGVLIYKGKEEELEFLYAQTRRKYTRDLKYFQDVNKFFGKSKMVDFYYAKLETKTYLDNIQKEFAIKEISNLRINNIILKNINNTSKLINRKIHSDIELDNTKKKLIDATNLLRQNPTGIMLASALVVKNRDEVYLLMDGFDKSFKSFNAKHLLIWKLIEKYHKLGYKRFNLGGITNPDTPNNKYAGLNEFKLNFNAHVYEYIGDLELMINPAKYFMYKKTKPISSILKK